MKKEIKENLLLAILKSVATGSFVSFLQGLGQESVGILGEEGIHWLNDNRSIAQILTSTALERLQIPEAQWDMVRATVGDILCKIDLEQTQHYFLHQQMVEQMFRTHCSKQYSEEESGYIKRALTQVTQYLNEQVLSHEAFWLAHMEQFYSAMLTTQRQLEEHDRRLEHVEEQIGRMQQDPDEDAERHNGHVKKLPLHQVLTLSDTMITADQDGLKNEVLLPWMKSSAAYRAVFPKIFAEPKFVSLKLKKPVSYPDLLTYYRDKHIVITGGAGIGKTTLLRYLYLYQNPNDDLLYLEASKLLCSEDELSDYEASVRNLIAGYQASHKHYLVLLDGIDEAFMDDGAALSNLISKMNGSKHLSVWFGWRSEHYAQWEDASIRRCITDVLSLEPWDMKMAQAYVTTYAAETHQPYIYQDFEQLLHGSENLSEFARYPFQLTLLVYLLENKNDSPEIQDYLMSNRQSIYRLYELFFTCWLQKERERGTSWLPKSQLLSSLQQIAAALYYGNSLLIEADDSAILGLLTFSRILKKRATGFYHRSFCAFFCAQKVYDAVQQGGIALVEALSTPLRNDVTDFVRSAISAILDRDRLSQIQEHLMDAYVQCVLPDKTIMEPNAQILIQQSTADKLFYLKNEVIYLATRIPNSFDRMVPFLEFAYQREKDPFMKLDFAYGAVLTGPTWIALEYAKSLVPGSESDLVNRSWTLAYFGDVQENPYKYRDDGKKPWDKARNVRLLRFQSQARKAIRFRILDIPLMYCFYVSRNWFDINEEDYQIIQQVDVECDGYSEEEKRFLKESKARLLTQYRQHLDMQAVSGITGSVQ